MKFTYEGPFDAVEVLVTVPRGSTIEVPDETGASLLSQPDSWSPDKKTLSTLTVPALHERAASLNVDVPSDAKKDEIVTAVLAFKTTARDTTTEES